LSTHVQQRIEDEIRECLERHAWLEAFELIVKGYQTKVFHLSFSIVRNREQAEDTTQEILLRIWRALPSYRGASALSTWIFAIARNAALTALTRGLARRAVSLEEPAVQAAALARPAPAAPSLGALETLVGALPEKQRQIVTLFYMEEQSYEDVARLLDMPLGTVKTHLFRARKELALRWQKEKANAVRSV
jgi:RNA polymerase sigma-70 factor (ECF subfamily)